MSYSKDLSIIIPLFNEEESLGELLAWIRSVVNAGGYDYEVIFVDDGSTDGSWARIKELAEGDDRVKGLSFRRNYGKSAALYHGFAKAEGRVVVKVEMPDGIILASSAAQTVSGDRRSKKTVSREKKRTVFMFLPIKSRAQMKKLQ